MWLNSTDLVVYFFSLLLPWSHWVIEVCSIKVREVLLDMEGQFPDSLMLLAKDMWSASSTYDTFQSYGHVAFIQSTHGALVIQMDLSQKDQCCA